MLYDFIRAHRNEILQRTRARVALRPAPPNLGEEHQSGIPHFLDELVEMLRDRKRSNAIIDDHATRHGGHRFAAGFTLTQVVHDYGDVCQVVTELAMERKATVTTEEFRDLNRCLDEAIAGAVTAHGRASQAALSQITLEESEALTQQMQAHLDTACVALELIKEGMVSVGGSTGAVLNSSLEALKDLLARRSALPAKDAVPAKDVDNDPQPAPS